ncbi:MAG: hypothetical protein Kow0059_09420 [Candidatus Sumerlaeia bacterium]
MNTLLYIFQLWRMKYWIAIVTAAAAVLGWYVTGLLSETYKAEALIFVKRIANFNPIEQDDIDPPVFQALLLSDSLLREVMEEYHKRYPDDVQPFKKFRKRFYVSSEVLTETAVRKDYSPLVSITAHARNAESASFLVNTWQSLAIQRYGDLLAREQERTYIYLENQLKELNAKIQEAQNRFSAGKWLLAAKVQELSNWLDILAPGSLHPLPEEPRTQPPLEIFYQSVSQFDLQLSERPERTDQPGLQNQLVQIDVEIARLSEAAEGLRAMLKDEPPSLRLEGADLAPLQKLLSDKVTPELMKEIMSVKPVSEQINPQYQFLKQSLAETERNLRAQKAARQRLAEKIAEVEQKTAALRQEVGELEPRVQQARREIEQYLKEKVFVEERFNIAALNYKQIRVEGGADASDTTNLFSVVGADAAYRVGPKRLTITGLIALSAALIVALMTMINVFVGEMETRFGAQGAASAIPAAPQSASPSEADKPAPDDPRTS